MALRTGSDSVQRRIASTTGLLLLTIAFAHCRSGHAAPAGPELTMTLSSYIGGSQFDSIRDIATDSHGNFYLAGATTSPNYPVTAGAFQTTHNPGTPESKMVEPFDAFVTKFDVQGNIVWSTFLGGPNYERAYGIEVDGTGNVYVAGRAGQGFPVTAGALQTNFNGGLSAATFYGHQDGFIAKLSPDGSKLLWATYFGTSDGLIIRDLALDQQGDLYIASAYSSGTFSRAIEVTFNNSPHGSSDALVAKVKGDGSGVIWATYLGGSLAESNQNSVRLDAAGNPYVLLSTESTDMPTTPGAYDRSYAGNTDLFVAKLTSQDGRLLWGTYLGGPQGEDIETHELAVDTQGNAYVASVTESPTFPTTPGAFQRSFGGRLDAFVAKISVDGTQLLASTFIGGRGNDRSEGIAVDGAGSMYFTGTTTSSNFPVTADAEQPALKGARDAFVVKLAPDFSRLSYSSYLGGARQEYGRAVGLDGQGVFYLGGETDSTDWPLRNRTSQNLTTKTAMFARFSPPGPQLR